MIDLKGVHTVRAKGRAYHYAWRGGPRLTAEPGSAAFVEQLAAAHAARVGGGDPAKIAGLCAAYRASEAWTKLGDGTRETWSPWLDRIQTKFGDLRIVVFDQPQVVPIVRKWRDQYKAKPRAADTALQVFSRLLSFAVEDGKLAANPIGKIKKLYDVDRSEIIWTDADLAQLQTRASAEIMHAATLASLTGLRRGDLLRLAWSHVGENAIELRTAKTGETALIPLYGRLREALAAIPKRSPVILTSSNKTPWTGDGFGASWNKALYDPPATKGAAPVRWIDKHFHDLRGTAATMLYRFGDLSIREIAQVMAWSEDSVEKIIDRYVKRDEILKDRIRRMDAASAKREGGE